MEISTGLNQGGAPYLGEAAEAQGKGKAAAAQARGEAASSSLQGKEGASAVPRTVLDGPSLVVTERTAAAFQAMAESRYETSMTIIGNMVDTPEERAEKAEREAERKEKELDLKERLQERDDARVRDVRLADEIAAQRVITDR